MKKIKFTCSSCQAKLRVPTHLAGVSAPCPKCGSTITAPTDLENVVDDSPRAPRDASAAPRESVPAAKSEEVASAAPASAAKVSVSMADGGNISGRVVAAPLPDPDPEPPVAPVAPVAPELPLPDPQPSELPVQEPAGDLDSPDVDSPIVEETIFIDPPAPEVPEESSEPVSPPPPVTDPPPVEHSTPADEDPVVETESEAPAAVPETQPIRINPRPSQLPPVREEESASAGELPRLDVNLAEQGQAGADSLSRNPSVPKGPTKVHLPQPGTEEHQFSPDDFIVSSQEESLSDFPVDEIPVEDIVADAYSESAGVPIDEIGEEEELEISEPEPDQGPEGYVHLDLPPLETGPEEVAPLEPAPSESSVAGSEPVENSSYAPAPEGGLDEGSFENLLSQQSEPTQLAYEEEDPAALTRFAGESAPESMLDEAAELPEELPVEPAGAPEQQMPAESPKTERDVLDEMFGESSESPGNRKKSTMILLSILGAAAIIAICFTAVIIKAMGGLSVSEKGGAEAPAPPPVQSKESATSVGGASGLAATEPSIADAPSIIDEVAKAPVTEPQSKSTVTLPGDTKKPVVIMDTSGAPPQQLENLSATEAARTLPKQPSAGIDAPAVNEPSALSIDERVQQIVNGDTSSAKPGSGISVIGGAPTIDPVENALEDFSNSIKSGAIPTGEQGASAADAKSSEEAAKPKVAKNYNPPASFDAPGPNDENQLGETHNLLDAFLRAPDWETRAKYTYQGDSLRPAMEDYYKAREFKSYGRFSTQLFQLEKDKEMGGPYWVYLISISDVDQGIPVIIREEEGKLKVDWEIYSEFEDRHFVQFQKGAIASPHTFRLVVERVSDYYGPDREKFSNLGDYYVYQVNPPYGDLNEHSDYAFVKKDSDLAKELDAVVGLGEQPLAMIITLEQNSFDHGSKHLVITEYVTEGWFR